MLRWLIGIILGEIICESPNRQHNTDCRCNFLDWKGLPKVHILFCLHKHQVSLNCNENKEISVANLMIQWRFIFFLGINMWSSFSMVKYIRITYTLTQWSEFTKVVYFNKHEKGVMSVISSRNGRTFSKFPTLYACKKISDQMWWIDLWFIVKGITKCPENQ